MCGRRDCSASAQPGGHGLRTMIPARSGVRTRAFRLAARRTKLTRAADPVLPKASFHARRDGNRAWQQGRERSRRRWRNWRHRRRDRRDGRGNGHDTCYSGSRSPDLRPLGRGARRCGSAGAASGGLVGALVGWSIPEERVKRYEEGIKKGGILLSVRPRSDEDAAYFEDSWTSSGAGDVCR